MSISQILNAQALSVAYRELAVKASALEQHLKQDYEAIKANLQGHVAHWESEVSRLESVVGAEVAALVKGGTSPTQAVTQVNAPSPEVPSNG